MNLAYHYKLAEVILNHIAPIHIEKMNFDMDFWEHIEYLRNYGYPNDLKHDKMFSLAVMQDGTGLNELHIVLFEKLHEIRNEKDKYAKQVSDLILLKFPKQNGTMNIEAAAKALNTSKHNIYKILQIGNYKGANYNIDLLQSILNDLRSF